MNFVLGFVFAYIDSVVAFTSETFCNQGSAGTYSAYIRGADVLERGGTLDRHVPNLPCHAHNQIQNIWGGTCFRYPCIYRNRFHPRLLKPTLSTHLTMSYTGSELEGGTSTDDPGVASLLLSPSGIEEAFCKDRGTDNNDNYHRTRKLTLS